ncbi:AAEL007907-PA, partial [Aedes aegypti]
VALGRRIGFYRFCGDIGRGNFSRVKLAVHQLTKDKVAIKVVDTSRLDAKALRMLSKEVSTLEAAFHPFILRLFEVIDTIGKIYLVSEWIPGGELYSRIVDIGALEEYHAAVIFYQLLIAVKYLHSLGYVHRDIKAENILMINEERIKLADFGFSTQLINGSNQHLDTFCGSPPYAAPELFSDDHYVGGPVDIWALGILLYFMLHARMPFKGSTIPLLRTAVLKGEYEISTSLSLSCCRLIQRILVNSPFRRPSMDQLLECQWFEYVQSPVIQKSRNCSNATGAESDISEVPNRRKQIFCLFSTRGQFRFRSSKNVNIVAANQFQTTVSQINTSKCSTKRANSVLEHNFLHPLRTEKTVEDLSEESAASIVKMHSDIDDNSQNKRKFSFRKVVRKRVSPIDILNERKSKTINTEKNISKHDFRIILQDLIVGWHGKQVMYPSLNSSNILPLESETRRLMDKLGISADMLEKTINNGPRSDILGIYRIIMHRLQKEQTIECISSNEIQSDTRNNISCSTQMKNWEKSVHTKPKKQTLSTVTCAIL